jgi:hypothetical protein
MEASTPSSALRWCHLPAFFLSGLPSFVRPSQANENVSAQPLTRSSRAAAGSVRAAAAQCSGRFTRSGESYAPPSTKPCPSAPFEAEPQHQTPVDRSAQAKSLPNTARLAAGTHPRPARPAAP